MLKRLRKLFGAPKPQDEKSTPRAGAADSSPVEPAPLPVVHRGPAIAHSPIPESDLDPDAVRIVRRLTRFDHTAYLVGGCVRDLLLGRAPKDFDIGTSATPRQVKRLFSNCRIIGRRFRLAHVYFQNGKIIEVATFRARDGQPEPAEDAAEIPEVADDLLIRDDNVFGTPEEDAVRRDFTINQLFYDVNSGNVLDHSDGLGDLRRRLVRTIGDPDVRFREDPIRILRAIKFAARLGFDIEPRTRQALLRTRTEIPKAAPPRILEEFNRFCRGAAGRRSFELMLDTGVFGVVLPELEAAYADADGEPRALLLALLDALDARADARAITTGEIFATLVTPVMLPVLGLTPEGPPAPPRGGVPSRELLDETLRPIAVRLRMSRRDQEHCRQVIATLHRLVPARAGRRGFRASTVRRPAFPDALVLLRTLADRWGGAYGEALAFWSPSAEEGPRPHAPAPIAAGRAEPAAPGGTAGPRRRRRRGGRGRRRDEGEAHAPAAAAAPVAPRAKAARPPAARPQPHGGPKLPPVWDDDYFFAALPTVPELGGEEAETDRYGARALAVAPDGEASPDDSVPGPPPDAAGPRRRRRRRSRRARGPGGGSASPPPESAD